MYPWHLCIWKLKTAPEIQKCKPSLLDNAKIEKASGQASLLLYERSLILEDFRRVFGCGLEYLITLYEHTSHSYGSWRS